MVDYDWLVLHVLLTSLFMEFCNAYEGDLYLYDYILEYPKSLSIRGNYGQIVGKLELALQEEPKRIL